MLRTPSHALSLIWISFRDVLPASARALQGWTERAAQIPDPELRKQALASLTDKRFHADGGCIYATGAGSHTEDLVRLIVAFQTISDYLDNLCDRSTSLDPEDFRQLHLSMLDSVTPEAPLQDYYRYRAEKDDGGYLAALVTTCQDVLRQLPGFPVAQASVRQLVQLYCDLQVHKHVRLDERVPRLTSWYADFLEAERPPYAIDWWEFSAATGSTLGMFMLFLASVDQELTMADVQRIVKAYFPWVNGLHILLDYLIDQEEDRIGGDLNFVEFYPTPQRGYERLRWFARQALDAVEDLENPAFHRLVIFGLVGMYLSDSKVMDLAPHSEFAKELTGEMGRTASFFHWISRYYRRKYHH